MKISKQTILKHWEDVLEYIGEDPNREGLKGTPGRIVRMYEELFCGYKEKPEDILTVFEDGACKEMVILSGIEFFSLCEHHLLPFFGTVSIGYIPNSKVVGVSKLARLVEVYSRRLQIQERMTGQIADIIMKKLGAFGAIVVIEAQHLCMMMRGVKKQNSMMTTSAIRGSFEEYKTRQEFLKLIEKRKV